MIARGMNHVTRQDERRRQALRQLQELEVLMRDGHFDYGNGFHGRVYLNPHQLFLHPSTIWRLAQRGGDVGRHLPARTDIPREPQAAAEPDDVGVERNDQPRLQRRPGPDAEIDFIGPDHPAQKKSLQ